VHAASRFRDKCYPLDAWRAVVRALGDEFHLVGLAGPASEALGLATLLPASTGPRRSAALFARLRGVLTNDSFPGHLAAAVGVPAVVLFGPSEPAVFGHAANRNLRSEACPPCADTWRQLECRQAVCLEALAPERVAAAARERFSSPCPSR
jgi:ADP-heptose:LPS heptosyltransferase